MHTAEMVRCTVTETVQSVANTSAAFVAANAKRLAVYLPGAKSVDITYSTLGAAVLYGGITVFAGGAGQWLNLDDHGPIVRGAINAIASAAGPTAVNSIEVIRAE